jgi:hypothetical protein
MQKLSNVWYVKEQLEESQNKNKEIDYRLSKIRDEFNINQHYMNTYLCKKDASTQTIRIRKRFKKVLV